MTDTSDILESIRNGDIGKAAESVDRELQGLSDAEASELCVKVGDALFETVIDLSAEVDETSILDVLEISCLFRERFGDSRMELADVLAENLFEYVEKSGPSAFDPSSANFACKFAEGLTLAQIELEPQNLRRNLMRCYGRAERLRALAPEFDGILEDGLRDPFLALSVGEMAFALEAIALSISDAFSALNHDEVLACAEYWEKSEDDLADLIADIDDLSMEAADATDENRQEDLESACVDRAAELAAKLAEPAKHLTEEQRKDLNYRYKRLPPERWAELDMTL
ncbi:MAG: hypothetical protein ACOX8X_03785 [Methanomethylophilus sp.]